MVAAMHWQPDHFAWNSTRWGDSRQEGAILQADHLRGLGLGICVPTVGGRESAFVEPRLGDCERCRDELVRRNPWHARTMHIG